MKKNNTMQIARLIILKVIIFTFATQPAYLYSQKKPKWLDKPEQVYNSQEYYYAIGIGQNRNLARENALEILASNISSEVSVTNETVVKEDIVITSDAKGKEEFTNSFTSKSVIKSENNLFNVSFDYYEPKKGPVKAIGYFNKKEVSDICSSKIQENNSNIDMLISNQTSLLVGHSNLMQALDLAFENETLFDLLILINQNKSESIKIKSSVEINNMIISLSNLITFKFDDQSIDPKLNEQITLFINSLGYSVVENNSEYLIRAIANFTEIDEIPDTKSIKWTLNLSVLENNSLIGSYVGRGFQDHFTISEAKEKAYRKMGEKCIANPEIKESLFGLK